MIVKRIIILSAFFFTVTLINPDQAVAGMNDLPVGTRSLGMGGTYVGIASNIETIFLNPGGLGQLQGTEIFLFYQKPFGLEDLSYGAVAIGHPIMNIQTGFGFSSFGNQIYREQRFTLSAGTHFRHKIYYGLALNYETIRINGYGATGHLKLDLGLLIDLSDALKWGFHTTNLNRMKLEENINDIPQTFKTGFSLRTDPRLLVAFEIFKEIRYKEEFRFGIEFLPVKDLAIRAGIANNPDRFSAGLGINVMSFRIDYAFFTHNDLGVTHQASLSINLGKPHQEVTHVEHQKGGSNQQIASQKPLLDKIDLNKAEKKDLMTLPGIGQTLADTILEYRKQNGSFKKIEDLVKVPGIGLKTFEKIRNHIFIGITK